MSIEDVYKSEVIRLCSINPLDVLDRICPELSLAGFSVSDFEVIVNLGEQTTWKALADVRLKSHVEKMSSELWLVRLRNIFRRYELTVELRYGETRRRARTVRGKQIYDHRDAVLFKIAVSPEMDLSLSFL
jgi:hypothetical protein